MSGDAYSQAVQEEADTERARRRGDDPPLDAFFDRGRVSRNCTEYARRIVRARLALYLRLVRRVEAWERGEMWPAPPYAEPQRVDVWRPSAWDARWLAYARPVPWRPLWTMAPQHDPLIPPWQRHGLPRRKRQ